MNLKFLQTYVAIFLVSTASLTYEIGLTRLFSIAQGYHFAFMVVSIALMGIGAGGAVLMAGRWFEDVDISRFLSTLAALFCIVSVASYVAANHLLFDPVKAAWSRFEFLKILAQYLILSLPFVISGMVVSAAIRSMSGRVHRIYLADMAGAGTGCLLVLYVLSISGGEYGVIVSAFLALAASLLFHTPSKTGQFLPPVTALAVLLIAAFSSESVLKAKMSPYRELSAALNFPGGRITDTIYSPSGRLDIVEGPAVRSAPGISLSYQKQLPRQIGFTVNGGGLATVTSREGDLAFLKHLPSSVAYRLRKGGDVFVIDPGGGMEVLSAIENGAEDVRGAEKSGVIIRAMREEVAGFSGGLYEDVEIIHGIGRNIIKDVYRKFDVIQLPLTGTFGASSSGIRGLQEDYGLTAEAFAEYLDHLKEGGFVSVSMYLLPPPRQELKLLSTVIETLEAGGVEDVEKRILAIRSWGVMAFLVKKGEIKTEEIGMVKRFCGEEGFDLIWYPGMTEGEANIYNRFPDPLYHRLFTKILDRGGREEFFSGYLFDIRPATDDRPFFGQTFKMTRMRETYESVGKKWGILIEGGYLLPWIFLQALLATVILIMTPLIFQKREKVSWRQLIPVSLYFAAIGIGYMFLEIALIQRMMPVLGEPVYAISAVLFTLLLSTGVGSYLSGRFRITERYSIHVILLLPLLIVLYLAVVGRFPAMASGFGITSRYVLIFILLFPLGATMGIPFPTGMSILGEKRAGLIPWAWCINGSFSVVSSTLVMMTALAWGFTAVQIIAGIVYIIAWMALIKLQKVV